jgi:hypothetical protein
MNKLSRNELSEIVLSDNKKVHDKFLSTFSFEVNSFIDGLVRVFDYLAELDNKMPKEERAAWVQMFLFSSFNSLLTSFHLLISGFLMPAGNLMRSWSEALAMALLCSHSQIDTFNKFNANPSHLDVRKAPDIVMRKNNSRLLNIDKVGWKKFLEINDFFSKYSHASAFALSSLMMFQGTGQLAIGGEFDYRKIDEYRKEIKLRISACERLFETAKVVEMHLAQGKHQKQD